MQQYGITADSEQEDTHLAYQEYLKRYLRCVKGVDDNLGRLFAFLKEQGLWENTVIIYTGDQGLMLGEHDYRDKRWMNEESMRMPFIVHYPPLVKAGSRSDAIINNTDYAPTMLELAGGYGRIICRAIVLPTHYEEKELRGNPRRPTITTGCT